MATGELVAAIAMSEPGAGSHLQRIRTKARRDGDAWRITGNKTFIINGMHASLVLVACKTGADAGANVILGGFGGKAAAGGAAGVRPSAT